MILQHLEKILGVFSKGTTRTNLLKTATLSLVFIVPEDYSPLPFTVDFMHGPSMIPTIHSEGEIYLRIKSWALESFKVGHVVVIKDIKGRYACKRIIGMENDEVQSKGEFYPCFGIPEIPSQNIFPSSWQKDVDTSDGTYKLRVGQIWLEGDNPLESIDSRHYGPLPISNVKGRLVYRLWPRTRTGDDTLSCFVSSMRPRPLEAERYHI